MVRTVLVVGFVLTGGCKGDAGADADPSAETLPASTPAAYVASSSSVEPFAGPAVLAVLAAECVDNGEGDECPHGPFGSIYVDFFADGALHWPAPGAGRSADGCLGDEAGQCSRKLPGPRTGGGECLYAKQPVEEWLDGDANDYDEGLALFRWQPAQNAVVARIWESDPGGRRLGRRHDVLGVERIERAPTASHDGVWIEFRRYTNEHPRQATSDVAFRLRVRTQAADERD